jgi:hypothetical protein
MAGMLLGVLPAAAWSRIRARVRSREVLSPVRLVAVASAGGPEPVRVNNFDAALVRINRPPARPCGTLVLACAG